MALLDINLQNRIARILANAIINHRIANAYLFAGPQGVGKARVAREFAQAVNCINVTLDGVCECLHCQAIRKQVFPDVIEVEPDGARLKVDQIRDLKSATRFGPAKGAYLVVIVHRVESFTPEAANSFLKLLEEPPAKVVFVLMTTHLSSILPTINSRCQVMQFSQLSSENVRDILAKDGLTASQIDKVAGLVQGELVLARLLSDPASTVWQFVDDMGRLGEKSVADILKLAESLATQEKDRVRDLIHIFLLDLSRAMISKDLMLQEKHALRKKMQQGMLTLQNLKYNINLRLHIENMLLQMKLLSQKAA